MVPVCRMFLHQPFTRYYKSTAWYLYAECSSINLLQDITRLLHGTCMQNVPPSTFYKILQDYCMVPVCRMFLHQPFTRYDIVCCTSRLFQTKDKIQEVHLLMISRLRRYPSMAHTYLDSAGAPWYAYLDSAGAPWYAYLDSAGAPWYAYQSDKIGIPLSLHVAIQLFYQNCRQRTMYTSKATYNVYSNLNRSQLQNFNTL